MSSSTISACYPEAIEFDCQACLSTLEVPFAALGASGPCPFCDHTATAPTLEQWLAQQPPQPLQPKSMRAIPGAPVPEGMVEKRKARRKRLADSAQAPAVRRSMPSEGLEDEFSDENAAPAERPVSPAASQMLNPDPRSDQRVQGRLERIRDRFRQRRIARIDDSGPSLPQILGWGTVALSLVAIGFGAAVAFYSVPLRPPTKQLAMPVDLTVKVMQEKLHQEKLRATAISTAQDAVAQFLHTGSTQGGSLEMYTVSGKAAEFTSNLFPDLKQEDLAATTCTRIPNTTDYLVVIEPKDERGPVLIVQQQAGKMLLHADALTQQADDTINQFLQSEDESTLVAYVLARPSQKEMPGLEDWPKLEILHPFPCDKPLNFVASAKPETETAAAIEARAGTTHPVKAVAEFKMSKTAAGKRFVELVRIIPNAWGKF